MGLCLGSCRRSPKEASAEVGVPTVLDAARPSQLGPPIEVREHPRLWVKKADLPGLRARANSNLFKRGLEPLARDLRNQMDAGEVPNDECMQNSIACESFAEIFAFMSLVHPNAKERKDYARRARTLLLAVLKQAARGPKENDPLRDPTFAVDDRSRWAGESFPLVVDWIYPSLTSADKKLIRKVFLRWCKEQLTAKVTNNNHPEPIGVLNEKSLLADPVKVRWSGNNYYAAHMRNMGLMAMALNPEDDPGGELRNYLDNATGAWLFVFDNMLRKHASGGLGAEGLQYQSQTMGYAAQLLYALQTAGLDKENRFGRQVVFNKNPFWQMAMKAYFHIQAPKPIEIDWRGFQHQLAWYGDGQQYTGQDFIDLVSILGLAAERRGDKRQLGLARWMQKYLPPGGAEGLYERVKRSANPREAILYFLLNPDGAPKSDPRRIVPTDHFAKGIGHIYSRTSWKSNATWFRYILGWNTIDHQHGEGNHFGFYRNGEWLTKKRVGYSHTNLSTSQFHNTLTVENGRPEHDDPDDYRYTLWKRGSQWTIGTASGDGKIIAHSMKPQYVYALGDATDLYNSDYEGVTETKHVSRSIMWIKPDYIVTYDRAETQKASRKKRFWLQLPNPAAVRGKTATMRTSKGQQLHVTSLLPQGAVLSSGKSEVFEKEIAGHEPMTSHLSIAPRENSERVEFLTVLEGADRGKVSVAPRLISTDKSYVGLTVAGCVVLFPKEISSRKPTVSYEAPAGTRRHFITGLKPNGSYKKAQSGNRVTISTNGPLKADSGGVLLLGK